MLTEYVNIQQSTWKERKVQRGPTKDSYIGAQIFITQACVLTLLPRTWLSDTTVEFGLKHLAHKEGETLVFSNSFFGAALQDAHGLSRVKRWCKRLPANYLVTNRIILTPVNIAASHWVLVVFDLNSKEITVLDSMHAGHERHKNMVVRMATWIKAEVDSAASSRTNGKVAAAVQERPPSSLYPCRSDPPSLYYKHHLTGR